jgi:hypothetical protein
MVFLALVESSFHIVGRGCVIVLDLFRSDAAFRLKSKDHIQLRYQDGRVLEPYIASVELVCGPKVTNHLAFLLPKQTEELDIPAGTEIWLAMDRA